MRKIFTRLAVALVLSLGLLGLSTTANAAPSTVYGNWVYGTKVDITPGAEPSNSNKTYNINAAATGSKVGKTMVATSVTCTYFDDPGPGTTWQDWKQLGSFTDSTSPAEGQSLLTTPLPTAQAVEKYCIDNAYRVPGVLTNDAPVTP